MTQLTLHDQLTQLRDALLSGLIEREVPVRLALLAALCGEHVLLVGPPGTAKSEIARRLQHAFKDASFFERLLTRFSVPEELFGPLSIKGLENDRYERQIQGYLPTAHVAFIDEIFKANSAILNALLTLLNERRFDQGAEQIPTPLICAIGASNEYPEGEELDALYDRFLLRYHVEPVSDGAFMALLDLKKDRTLEVGNALKLSQHRIKDIQDSAQEVTIPQSIQDKLSALRIYLKSPQAAQAVKDVPEDHPARQFRISDRRWRKIVQMLKISAYTNGRTEVDDLDLLLLIDAAWNLPQQRPVIKEWLLNTMGAENIDMPENTMKLITTYTIKCKKFEENQVQKIDNQHRPIFLGENDEEVVGEIGNPPPKRFKTNDKGERLYSPPDPDHYTTTLKEFSEKDLESIALKQHGNTAQLVQNRRWISIKDYIEKYPIYESCPPCMVQEVVYKSTIIAMCKNLSNASNEAIQETEKLKASLDKINLKISSQLWLFDDDFIKKSRSNIQEHIAHMNNINDKIEALIIRLKRIPVEDL